MYKLLRTSLLITVVISTSLISCQKENAVTNRPVKQNNTLNDSQVSVDLKHRQDSTDVSADSLSSRKLVTQGVVSNCGIASVTYPPADAVILQSGTIMGVNQPSYETPLPSSYFFGPNINAGSGYYYRKYELRLQNDGNLVLYSYSGPTTKRSLWNTQTASTSATQYINSYLKMQTDGNLILQHRDNNGNLIQTWASNRTLCANQNAPILLLQNDGNIVEEYDVYDIGNKTHAVIGNTGTANDTNSNHPGQFY